MFTENICSACIPMQVAVSCKHVLILLNNDSTFLTLTVAYYLNLCFFTFSKKFSNQTKVVNGVISKKY